MKTTHLFVASAALAAATSASAQALRINEIRVDQPGADLDEYIEIAGAPGTVLNNIFYIVIGDAAGSIPPAQNGSIETVINLSGAVIPADGTLLVAKNSFALGPIPDVIATFTLEEIDNTTHLLVQGFSGSNGQDLDTNNDGVLDVTPWTAIVDDLALVINPAPNGISAEFIYSSTIVGPDGAFSPSHVWRCADTLAWNVGTFNFTGLDTPGQQNAECLSGPEIVINEIRIEQPGPEADEYFELRGPAGGSLQGLTYVVIGDPDDDGANTDSGVVEAVIPLSGFSLNANGFFLVAEDADTFGSQADLIATLNFEGSDNFTHLLVLGFTGADGEDLDTNDDGVLDVTPWDAVVDSVAILRSSDTPPAPGSEWVYSETTVGPEGIFVPGHVYRCVPDGDWLIGAFDPASGVDTPGFTNSECTVCGVPGSGGCFDEQTTPGCDNSACCNTICGIDPACCDVAWDLDCVAQAKSICLVSGGPPAVLINELRIDQTGADNDEYFELSGAPGTSLDGVFYVVIGDGAPAAGSGIIETVVDLSGFEINANGLFVVAESTLTLGVADLTVAGNALNFENSDNVTHLIVFNFTGFNGQDVDLNDDGALDKAPWSTVIDSIGLITANYPPIAAGQEWVYAPTLGPDGTFVAGHVYRCVSDGTWTIGDFDPSALTDTVNAANLPCGFVPICGNPASPDCFTVGEQAGCSDAGCCEIVCDVDPACCKTAWDQGCVDQANELCLISGEPPAILINEFRIDQPLTDNDEYVEISGAPGTSLDGVAYVVIGDGASALGSGVIEAVIDLTGQVIPASGFFVVAESTFTLGTADLVVGATGLNFENGDNVTHALVFNFTGANGQDLDLEDDGVLDVTPWQSVIDSVGLIGPNYPPRGPGQEWVYSSTLVGPEVTETGTFVPVHPYRCSNGNDWLIGPFDPMANVDTPGAINPADCLGLPCDGDLDGSGAVDGADLGILLGNWGTSGDGDIDGSGMVDGADLGLLLGAWGPCS